MAINWNNIRALDNSQNEGFEELVCQLARNEDIPNKKKFIRKGKPDAGVECFWILENGDEWAWQAKFFTSSLDETQWAQIDKSVRTVLDKHHNLKRFYIAIPNDPPDARITGQKSMLEKWDARVEKWERWALEKSLEVGFVAWWSSDLIARLSKTENQGLTYFWFNKEEFNDKWFLENTQQSISDLGKRYTPNFHDNLNVDVGISQVFNGIFRDDKLKSKLHKLLDFIITDGNKALSDSFIPSSEKELLAEALYDLDKLFFEVEFNGIDIIPINIFNSLINNVDDICNKLYGFYLAEEDQLKEVKSESLGRYKKHGKIIDVLDELQYHISNFNRFLKSEEVTLINNPYLILEGEAGIGKSHLLADVITKRNELGVYSLFLLGQHFVTEEDPWTQIKKKLDIGCSFIDFLGALSAKAETSRQRLIIFIDAINEGKGKYFWPENIRGFIQQIKRFPWIGLVFSVRSSYSNLLVPKDLLSEDMVNRVTHYGFYENEYEASNVFFDSFRIELPSIPLLHPEFQNPLFLLLFCEGLSKAGCSRVPDGLQGISDIISFFVKGVNKQLSKPIKLDYSESINIVEKAINIIISKKYNNRTGFISYESAFIELNRLSNDFGIKKGLLDSLISEGVLSKNMFLIADKNEYEEGIYLSYERFEDHMTAKFLLETYNSLEVEFQKNGFFYNLFKSEILCYRNKGLLEALSIQLPELKGKEFFYFAPYVKNIYPVVESFVQSLIWRKIETANEELIKYINFEVFSFPETEELFLETVVSVCSNPIHCFNSYFLHRNLFNKSLAERDGWWTASLENRYIKSNAIKRLIDWAWSDCNKKHISNESKKLSAIAIAWHFTSTNRLLRDEATKALVCLLKDNLSVLIELLKTFENVNDPYVYERLFAVAYGCALTTKDKDSLKRVSNYILETIFDTDFEEIYPHILLRDYARGVIEYTCYVFVDFDIDIERARPPYRSDLPKEAPSNEELDEKYKVDFNQKEMHLYSQNLILSSMTTEYGRGTSHYGDFGRYTFQSALRSWEVNPDKMSNIAVDWIFTKYGYNAELHGRFDRNIGAGREHDSKSERIGKKYQWIVLHEILARVSDNCVMKSDRGWQDNESEPYEGTWQPYVRDIDPSMPLRKTREVDGNCQTKHWWLKEKYDNWKLSDKNWINNSDDLPNVSKLINVTDEENNEWLVLDAYSEWAEPKLLGQDKWKQHNKNIWHKIKSYLVSEEDSEKFINWAKVQDFMGNWMPEASQLYQVFEREYYWSPAFNCFNNNYHGGIEQYKITDRDSHEFICNVTLTSSRYCWEKGNDNSIEETFDILKPSRFIYNNMGLTPSEKVAEFYDKNSQVVCYSPSVYSDSKPYLLVRKKEFIDFLQKNKLKIIWTVLGEKNIVGGYSRDSEHPGRLEISGAYYLNKENNIDGLTNTKLT